MEALLQCVRFYKCVIIARYDIALRCRDVRLNNFNYVCIIFIMGKTDCAIKGVSTQLQSSGLVAHENSTFRNLALAVSGPFMA